MLLKPLGMSACALARAIGVDPPWTYKIVAGERGISGNTALRLASHSSPKTTSRYDRRDERAVKEASSEMHVPYRALGSRFLPDPL